MNTIYRAEYVVMVCGSLVLAIIAVLHNLGAL